ncbi:predicted protein [Uncinocarpus reesii 1704]|uniref:Aminoglycoside phosphotransferase domain-containing protein n=1 Tax=Uncinocarpus reesii (strain UAMH 1704) TaxID=336963 RepID=C4JN38_UNCRE|nr:uncharacterized protein UREG_04246 [Uncinocarpus reesii 1704]EEP79400.1 predicted protein [Uncinocarpus reesii 1704]
MGAFLAALCVLVKSSMLVIGTFTSLISVDFASFVNLVCLSSMNETAIQTNRLEVRFGSLVNITETSLLQLAARFYWQRTGIFDPFGRLIDSLNGSYNIVHIVEFRAGEKYVIRIPATGWGDRFTQSARRAFVAQIRTMQYIKKNTTLPIPEIYGYNDGFRNEIGAPFMVMGYVHGVPVNKRWFDESGPGILEERRLRILDSLAETMSQLQNLKFDRIGTLVFDQGGLTIGPCYRWYDGTFGQADYGKVLRVEESGPFSSSQEYLQHCLASREGGEISKDPIVNAGSRALLEMIISCLPPSTNGKSDNESFVLGLQDFNWQNIMTDETGRVTGIVDWDNVQTMPRHFGYACFPFWLAVDWNPVLYHFRLRRSFKENTPEALRYYRQVYYNMMAKYLHNVSDLRLVRKSHIFGSLLTAATNPTTREHIVRKILEEAMGADEQAEDVRKLIRMASGGLSATEEDSILQGFRTLLFVPN